MQEVSAPAARTWQEDVCKTHDGILEVFVAGGDSGMKYYMLTPRLMLSWQVLHGDERRVQVIRVRAGCLLCDFCDASEKPPSPER